MSKITIDAFDHDASRGKGRLECDWAAGDNYAGLTVTNLTTNRAAVITLDRDSAIQAAGELLAFAGQA